MSNLTQFEKNIYNCYLKNFRKGEPFKYRKDFSNVHPNVEMCLKKISAFLSSYSHIDVEEYFEAPHHVHKDEKYPSLKAFTSRTAIKTYSLYQKYKEDRNPELQQNEIKKSFQFIGMYCIDKKIDLDTYLFFKEGYAYAWMDHYRQRKINPYCLFILGDVFGVLSSIPKDERLLFAQNLEENLVAFKNRYTKSPKTQTYCKELHKKVKDFVKKELTNT